MTQEITWSKHMQIINFQIRKHRHKCAIIHQVNRKRIRWYNMIKKPIYISRKGKHWLFNRKCQYTAVSCWMNVRLKVNKPHHSFWPCFHTGLMISVSRFMSHWFSEQNLLIELRDRNISLQRIILDDKNSKHCVDSTREWRWKRADQGKLEDFLTNVCSCTS